MKTLNPENNINSVEDAHQSQSKVTPKKTHSKLKYHVLFVSVIACCVMYGANSLMTTKQSVRTVSEQSDGNLTNGTLTQNLTLIAQLKAKAERIQAERLAIRETQAQTPVATVTENPNELTPEILARMNAPMSFSGNRNHNETTTSTDENLTTTSARQSTLTPNNANAQFVNAQDDIVSVEAKRIAHPAFMVPAGEMIPATLEVAMNSELPGMVRATTMRDVYSLLGEKKLIPKGSTLVGQFNAQVAQGQSRLLVVWERVQMPDGIIVTLASPGTDMLGRSGMGADSVDRHFFDRFGTSALLSILGGVTANSGVKNQDQYNSQAQYRMGIATSLQQSAGQTLEQDMQIKPTMQINQGARITVFVAHDLDFYKVGIPKIPRMASVRSTAWKQ